MDTQKQLNVPLQAKLAIRIKVSGADAPQVSHFAVKSAS
jgi:hypothetical protein